MAVDSEANAILDKRLIGNSHAFREVVARIKCYSACDAPVLIEGETGTGKELVARALHYLSKRQGGPFVPVNCAALPDQLVVNELFGHERGAFTGAQNRTAGLVEQARRGTILFDEVDTLALPAQAVLLRFLQDQEYRPLGSGPAHQGDVRILAASNAGMSTLVQSRSFRGDLFYRLNVLALRLPPLRTRVEDIPLLAAHFLTRFHRQYGGPLRTPSPGALGALCRYDWPGNVRELENRLHRAFLLASGPRIEEEDLDLPPVEASASGCPASGLRGGFANAKVRAIADFEHTYLCRLMAETCGNVSAASRLAAKERRALTRLLKKHGIDRRQYLMRSG